MPGIHHVLVAVKLLHEGVGLDDFGELGRSRHQEATLGVPGLILENDRVHRLVKDEIVALGRQFNMKSPYLNES